MVCAEAVGSHISPVAARESKQTEIRILEYTFIGGDDFRAQELNR
jgi:hypothetical protein